MKREQWRAWSACRGMDVEIFFPDILTERTAAPAKVICGNCPVRQPCLDYAVSITTCQGIWAGTTEKERERLRRRRNHERRQSRIAAGDIVPRTNNTAL